MEKICSICKKLKKTPYRDICRNCYQKEWKKNIPFKSCHKCGKSFHTVGDICHPCYSNERNYRSRTIPCSECKRVGLIIMNKELTLCIKCNRQKQEIANPDLANKRRDYLMKYSRKKKGTDLNAPKRIKRGRWKTVQGYIMLWKPDNPNSDINGCIREHTFVMSEKLGRPLKPKENVHHINGIKDDNRIENLELWHKGQCSGQRLKEKLYWCKEFLLEYGYTVSDPRGAFWEVMKVEDTPLVT